MVYNPREVLLKKKKANLDLRKTNLSRNFKFGLNNYKYFLYLPKPWFFFLLRNNLKKTDTIVAYCGSYIIRCCYFNGSVSTKCLGSLNLIGFFFNHHSRYIFFFLKNINSVSQLFYVPEFLKLKFRGKGYYIYKNVRNTVAPQFGYAHRVYIYSFFSSVKFLTKTKILIFGLIKSDTLAVSLKIKSKRRINIYTGRGVRFSQQKIYAKTGKVSSYR